MQRTALSQLERWKASPNRKPLLVKGVRQVGKTWLLREFGQKHYHDTAYFNFDENPEYSQFFEKSKSPERIVQNLSVLHGRSIVPGKTLLILDEIQSAPNALGALKYFCEEAPEYHVACAGSLLGVAVAKPSAFPVGKVNFLHLHPMSFSEFLLAAGDASLVSYLHQIDRLQPVPDAFHTLLSEKLRMYFITGGMPESVRVWTQDGDVSEVEHVLSALVEAYERDFSKHPDSHTFPKLTRIWQSLPTQLARENKKFTYAAAYKGARAREYEDALQWLVGAGLVYRVQRASAPSLPLPAYEEPGIFKIYLSDVGILRRRSGLSPSAAATGNRVLTEFKGALTENYVLQSLVPQFDIMPHYWAKDGPSYEVDFLVQHENAVLPIEVKSGSAVRSTSLRRFGERYSVPVKVRFSAENLRQDGDVLNIPLYLADEAARLMSLALREAT